MLAGAPAIIGTVVGATVTNAALSSLPFGAGLSAGLLIMDVTGLFVAV